MTDNVEAAEKPTDKSTQQEESFIEFDRHFLGWIDDVNGSIVLSSYKKNQVMCVGSTLNIERKQAIPSLWMSDFVRPMGLCVGKSTLWVGSANLLWRHVENGKRESHDKAFTDFDMSYIPRELRLINDIDCHDIVEDSAGKVYFVSALFGCVCNVSNVHSFKVFWSPPWQSKVAAEDRCHLNGLCTVGGVPKYVSCIARTDVRGGWRENRTTGGVIFDIVDNVLVSKNICMPHSPRWHREKLWVLESGTGHLGYVDFDTTETSKNELTGESETYHKFVQKIFIPGYLRGLSFISEKYAVVGSSLDRHEKVFQDIPLGENIKKKGVSAKCGVFIIDLDTMDVVHEIIFNQNVKAPVNEIYDVCTIKGSKRVVIENINSDSLLREYSVGN